MDSYDEIEGPYSFHTTQKKLSVCVSVYRARFNDNLSISQAIRSTKLIIENRRGNSAKKDKTEGGGGVEIPKKEQTSLMDSPLTAKCGKKYRNLICCFLQNKKKIISCLFRLEKEKNEPIFYISSLKRQNYLKNSFNKKHKKRKMQISIYPIKHLTQVMCMK